MELQDIISSSLKQDIKEIQKLQERKEEIKEECNEHIQLFKTCVKKRDPKGWYENERVFRAFFGDEFYSFSKMFVYNMDQLEKQLEKEDFHECISKTCLAVLKKQFETFLYRQPPDDSFEYSTDYGRDVSIYLVFREYTHDDVGFVQNIILYYLDGIEERIDARAHHEKELMIKERDAKEGWEHEKRLNEFEMHKQDTMIHKSKCSRLRENTNAGDGKISKDASEIDNNVARVFP
ncbi:hypothetical protein Tco_0679186 [Tanacetum coccineum]|uniref:Uncharacterized protein n=1 Tax=Tanacetum coccineum TaxID=301880 RepID=A0ABQ4XH93_9ASTR